MKYLSLTLVVALFGALFIEAKSSEEESSQGPAAQSDSSGRAPIDTQKYVDFAQRGQSTVQGQADQNFENKKDEGTEVQKAGENAEAVGKVQGQRVADDTNKDVWGAIEGVEKAHDEININGGDEPPPPREEEKPEEAQEE